MTDPKDARSLYDCFWPKCHRQRVVCDKGHRLHPNSADGSLNVRLVDRGDPLILTVCANCPDFSSMGEPVPPELKGYLPRRTRIGG